MRLKLKPLIFNSVAFVVLALYFAACSPSRHLPDQQYLLNRSTIEVDGAEVKKEELTSFLRQKPNRRILGFYRFHLNVYQYADRRSQNRFNRWLKNTVGEPPVVYQPVLMESTRDQLEMYLQSKGYFNARVDASVKTRKKKAAVTYSVQGNTPYTIRDIQYKIDDLHLASFIYADTTRSLIQRNQRYDSEVFQQERERLTRVLKNQGFFAFSKEFILFQVDSTVGNHQVDLFMVLLNPVQSQGAATARNQPLRHKRYIINEVLIYPDHSPFSPRSSFPDTTIYFSGQGDKQLRYTFLHDGNLRIGHKTLVENILLEPGKFFRIRDVEQSYNYLSGLRNFRFINLQFSPERQPLQGTPNDTLGYLNASVQLARSPANAFTVEAEGINSSGNLGVAGNILFQNRNMFRGAEIFNLRLKGALEATAETASGAVIQSFPFNTLELGAEVSIDFPKLLSPIRFEHISKNARPESTILSGINYRQRPDYTRYILNISYGLEWSENPRKRHYLHPLEISSIKIFNDSLLQAKIPENNPLILSRFKNHLIAGSKYTYTYNSQELATGRNFMYFRGNFETAGNLLHLIASSTGSTRDANGSATLFNIPFAQYVKGDVDLRYYLMLAGNSSLALRAMAGIGVPYGNTSVLPFIKSYYGGGANGIRAWRIYSLGPGGHQNAQQLTFDKYGDIKLEANIEYRFPIYSFWHGALFADAGNVWFIEDNPQFPDGSFQADRFYREIAIGTGLGLRMDFGFFVVRVDMGVPVRDPGLPAGKRWINNLPRLNQYNLNLGIGYPF